jgi:hypothetical protein
LIFNQRGTLHSVAGDNSLLTFASLFAAPDRNRTMGSKKRKYRVLHNNNREKAAAARKEKAAHAACEESNAAEMRVVDDERTDAIKKTTEALSRRKKQTLQRFQKSKETVEEAHLLDKANWHLESAM